MNFFLMIILGILILGFLIDALADLLNLKALSLSIPEEFCSVYDPAQYQKMQDYTRATTRFGLLSSFAILALHVLFILMDGYAKIDQFVRSWTDSTLTAGWGFAFIVFVLYQMCQLPFSYYRTFVIEERFGFNQMSPGLFFKDLLKGWLLLLVIGGLAYTTVLIMFESWGRSAWIICWGVMAFYQMLLMYIAPVILMPLFNKFSPLEDGELKREIEQYADREHFRLKGIFVMDGSRRSSKSNAFFTGFGRNRRIVLFDTLIESQSVNELVSVLAHEMGHYKLKHIIKMIVFSLLGSALMFYLLGVCLNHPGLFRAFGMSHVSVYASLFFFGYLYVPISAFLSVILSGLSRKHEFEADAYAARTYDGKALIKALKSLSRENLVNLRPHPLKIFLEHSHPPILERIKRIEIAQAR